MVTKRFSQTLFVFEMANNHMGDVNHGLRIIRAFHKVSKNFDFQFGFKFQYRDLDTFIHPDFKGRQDIKYVKRFMETRLREEEFKLLKDELGKLGFVSICTPFDENSVDLIEKHNFDVIKVASCSFTDWPLLERIVKTDKPIIASTAGISLDDIDKVVTFFEHRNKDFCLMHCVGEYPTSRNNLELNQIDVLRQRYPEVPIGYSTHEDPNNFEAIKIAISKGAVVFERNEHLMLNDLSIRNLREKVLQIIKSMRQLLIDSKVTLPDKLNFELSHHYGIENFEKLGAAIISCINREYCKKLIILLPGQSHPVHHHIKKEETFHVLYGDVTIDISGDARECKPGDIIVVERGMKHSFSSRNGVIFEEVSTTHYKDDSYYEDEKILENKNRKTEMTFWSDWLYKNII